LCLILCLLPHRNGNLEIFTLAIDQVPSQWREDPTWRGRKGGGNPQLASHNAACPSRWIPKAEAIKKRGTSRNAGNAPARANKESMMLSLIDYVLVEKRPMIAV
jgi:hypothetical protein